MRILNSSSVQTLISVSFVILNKADDWEVIDVVVRTGYRDLYAYLIRTNTWFLSIMGYTSLKGNDEKGMEWDRAMELEYLLVCSFL